MSVYLNFDVFELYTHTYISCTLADNTSRHCTHRWVAQSKSDRFHFVRIRVWFWGFGSSPGLKIGVLAFFFLVWGCFGLFMVFFFFALEDVERGVCGISQPSLIKWNLPCCIEPHDLDDPAWPPVSSAGADPGGGRGPLWMQHNCGGALLDWQTLCEEEAYWLYDCVPVSVRGGHVLWITEADFVFNHETVNRHLLISPKKTQNKLTLEGILDTQVQIISHLVSSFQY